MALFAPWLPEGVRRDRGRLTARLSLQPEMQWRADIDFSGLHLGMPGSPMVLERTSGRVALAGDHLVVEGVRGFFSGREITLGGELRLDGQELKTADMRLRGTNLPLIRSSDLFLKTDLDLRFVKTVEAAQPVIRGRVRPRDGLYLQDLLSMLQPGTLTAEQRPPYFSVDIKPFADWLLDVDVVGEKALRIHTALFRGVVSTNLRLVNTLEDPRLTGEVVLDSGTVTFPYGRIHTRSGEIRFDRGNPHHPQLDIRGSGRAFGYQLDMELSGPINEARIEFDSDPPLRTEEVLLLLTAGTIPGADDGEGGLAGTAGRLAFYLGQGILGMGGSERLNITSGEDITESGNETFSVEYELRRNFSLIGEYDKFDDYNLDLNWRIRRP